MADINYYMGKLRKAFREKNRMDIVHSYAMISYIVEEDIRGYFHNKNINKYDNDFKLLVDYVREHNKTNGGKEQMKTIKNKIIELFQVFEEHNKDESLELAKSIRRFRKATKW